MKIIIIFISLCLAFMGSAFADEVTFIDNRGEVRTFKYVEVDPTIDCIGEPFFKSCSGALEIKVNDMAYRFYNVKDIVIKKKERE